MQFTEEPSHCQAQNSSIWSFAVRSLAGHELKILEFAHYETLGSFDNFIFGTNLLPKLEEQFPINSSHNARRYAAGN